VIGSEHERPRNVEARISSVIRDTAPAIKDCALLKFKICATQWRIGSVAQQPERCALGYPHEVEEPDMLFLERLLEAVNFLRFETRGFID
jgi:hypothetical protein